MRVEPLSNCEKSLIWDALKSGKRLDFRKREEFRDVKLVVGAEIGTAICTVGQTKVLCAVSAQIGEPSSMRPQKGVINIDVDLSPMANNSHEHDRLGQKGMELTRLLELIIRDSRCIDVESLCIRSGKEVWKIRVDIRILDEDGSLLDCACLAAITALQHFKRPNVNLEPHHTLIYSEYEKAPIPLNIYHMPICTTIGLLEKGQLIVIDPTEKESLCLDGSIVIACNRRKEVCALHQSMNIVLSTKQIENCVRIAMKRTEELTKLVSETIKSDQRQRSALKKPDGFAITTPNVLLNSGVLQRTNLKAPTTEEKEENEKEKQVQVNRSSMIMNANPLKQNSVKQEDVNEEEKLNEQLEIIQQNVDSIEMKEFDTDHSRINRKREVEEVDDLLAGLGDDSEEEELVTLHSKNKEKVSEVLNDDNEEEEIVLKAKKKKKI